MRYAHRWEDHLLRVLAFSAMLLATASCGQKASAEEATEEAVSESNPPNVLFIAVDDLNDWVGYTGTHPDARTPNIDALAERGTAFTQAFSQYPLCGPSRASLFSGMLPSTLDVFGQPRPDTVVSDAAAKHNSALLHSYFSQNGYKTMGVGKLLHRHLPEGSVDVSGDRGDWDTMPDGKEVQWVSDRTLTDWAVYPAPEEEMSDAMAAQWATERLAEDHDSPFMLMVGFLRPHVPWYVPQQYFDAIGPAELVSYPPYKEDDLDDLSAYSIGLNFIDHMPRTEWARETGVWQDAVHAYLASVNFADHYVGQVLDALEASPYADNTIIVLFSDHGYLLGEKNTFQKHSLWERANKVPLIIAGPNLPEGQRRSQTVGLIDIYPTLLELAGLPANPVNEGHSLAALIGDANAPWDYPAITQFRRKGDDEIERSGQAIQSGPWRYSQYADGSEELYNHEDDPNEWTNLAAPELADPHRELMDKLSAQLPSDFFESSTDETEDL
jgi:arylsulfatase A-like enzyme